MSLVMVALMLLAGGGSDTAKWAAVNRGKAGLQVISHRSHCSDTCITLFFFFSQLFISFSFNLSNKKFVNMLLCAAAIIHYWDFYYSKSSAVLQASKPQWIIWTEKDPTCALFFKKACEFVLPFDTRLSLFLPSWEQFLKYSVFPFQKLPFLVMVSPMMSNNTPCGNQKSGNSW